MPKETSLTLKHLIDWILYEPIKFWALIGVFFTICFSAYKLHDEFVVQPKLKARDMRIESLEQGAGALRAEVESLRKNAEKVNALGRDLDAAKKECEKLQTRTACPPSRSIQVAPLPSPSLPTSWPSLTENDGCARLRKELENIEGPLGGSSLSNDFSYLPKASQERRTRLLIAMKDCR